MYRFSSDSGEDSSKREMARSNLSDLLLLLIRRGDSGLARMGSLSLIFLSSLHRNWGLCMVGLSQYYCNKIRQRQMRRPPGPSIFSTQECKQMMHKNFGQFVNQQFLNEGQEGLVEKCSTSLRKDQEKEERIKTKLISQFFNKHKRRNTKQELRNKYNLTQSIDQGVRNQLAKKMRESLSIVLDNRSPSISRNSHHRYGDNSPLDFSFSRPFPASMNNTPHSQSSKKSTQRFKARIDTIIQESNRIKTRQTYSRKQIKTASDRKRQAKLEQKREKNEILDRIIQSDIDDYLKSYSVEGQGQALNPEVFRERCESRRRKELSPLDKYNMSFIHYVRQKTNSNIQKSIYNEKIRHKNSYIQKFQTYILEEFKFSEESKRRLERLFEGIEQEFKGPVRNREIRQRIKPK